MASTYLVEVTDDARTAKVVLALEKPEVQRPAVDFVFDVLGSEPAALATQRHLSEADAKVLAHLQDLVFTHDDQGLLIREGVEFQANKAPLDPDAQLEEYFLPRPDRPGNVFICELEVLGADPDRQRRRQMLAYQVMFALHRFKRGYHTTMDDVDRLRPITDEAEAKDLLKFDLSKNTFVLTPTGEKVYQSLVDEAQELIKRYDVYADVTVAQTGRGTGSPDIRFGTGLGDDLRVPMWELHGINPFRARFVLGLNDGEWDDLSDWPRQISSPRWFDDIFEAVERAPAVADLGRELCEAIGDEGRRQLLGDRGACDAPGSYTTTETYYDYGTPGYGAYYRDPYFNNSLWWLMFLM